MGQPGLCPDVEGRLRRRDRGLHQGDRARPGAGQRLVEPRLFQVDDGDLDGGLADCTKAVSLEPRNASALAKRGFAKEKKADLDGALADYELSLALRPDGRDSVEARASVARLKALKAGSSHP